MPGPGTQATRSEAHTPATAEAESADDDSTDRLAAGESLGAADSLTVPGHAGQVPKARAFIARVLAGRQLCDETACLLGSELVTNSIRHSDSRLPGGTVTVTVVASAADILVEVTDDAGGGQPVLRDGPDLCAEDGRGLFLVAMLSARWGYHHDGARLTTWFQVPAEPARVP